MIWIREELDYVKMQWHKLTHSFQNSDVLIIGTGMCAGIVSQSFVLISVWKITLLVGLCSDESFWLSFLRKVLQWSMLKYYETLQFPHSVVAHPLCSWRFIVYLALINQLFKLLYFQIQEYFSSVLTWLCLFLLLS